MEDEQNIGEDVRDIAMGYRYLITVLEELTEDVLKLKTAEREKEKLLKLHEQVKTTLEEVIEINYPGIIKMEKYLKENPVSIENAKIFDELKKSLDKASELAESERFKECMSKIIEYLDILKEFEMKIENSQ